MSTNNVVETSTSTGSGDFTLAGAWNVADSFNTGNRTFFDAVKRVNHQFVYKIQDKLGNWEKGWGYLSAPTTLVRYTVLDTSAGVGDRNRVDFPAGEKLVFIPTEAKGVGAGAVNTLKFIMSPHNIGAKSSNMTATVNRAYYVPFVFDTPTRVTAIGQYIRNTVAGAVARVAVYNANKQLSERPGAAGYDTLFNLVVDLGTVDVSSPGLKAISCDEVFLKGVYLIAVVYSGAVSVMQLTANNVDLGLAHNSYESNALGYFFNDSTSHINGFAAQTANGILTQLSGGTAFLIQGNNL